METAGYPAPPAGSGFTCAQRGGRLFVSAHLARFVVTSDELDATWQTVWQGRQQRRLPRSQVREVLVAPDTPSAASRDTTQLRIELTDGEPIVPLRRRPLDETVWVANRLREALEMSPREWPSAAPAFERPKPRGAAGPRPVAPIGPPSHVLPPPVRNVRAARRGDRLTIRVGRPRWWAQPRATGLLTLLAILAFFAIFAATTRFPGAIPVGLVLLFAAAWEFQRIAPAAWTSHVILLSPRGLHVASVGRFKHDRQFIPRERIAGVAAGAAHQEQEAAELHVFLVDGGYVEFLTGRNVDEINFVAFELAGALPRIPPAPPRGDVAAPAAADRILPYEPPPRPLRQIDVRADVDRGVTIFIPPPRHDRLWRLVWIVPLVLLVQAGFCVLGSGGALFGEAWPAVLFIITLIAAWVAASGGLRMWRGDAPTVVGVDRDFLYADFPHRFRRRKRWKRDTVRDVQLIDVPASGRGGRAAQWIEIVFLDYTAPIRLCANHTDADRQRLVAVLRAALELPAGS